MEDNSVIIREEGVSVWEKRLTLIVITALVGYIATVASGVKSQLDVIDSGLRNAIKIIEKHDGILSDHTKDLRVQDTRLTRVEVKVFELHGPVIEP